MGCIWETLEDNNVMNSDKPQRNYPIDKIINSPASEGIDCTVNVISPHIQTNYWKFASAKLAHNNNKTGKWNKAECSKNLAKWQSLRRCQKALNQL